MGVAILATASPFSFVVVGTATTTPALSTYNLIYSSAINSIPFKFVNVSNFCPIKLGSVAEIGICSVISDTLAVAESNSNWSNSNLLVVGSMSRSMTWMGSPTGVGLTFEGWDWDAEGADVDALVAASNATV